MSTGGRRVVLWRHGRTEWNASGRFQGQLDPPLDQVGRAQAAAAASVLAGMRPAVIVTSDQVRARDTALALADGLGMPVLEDPRLREINLGTWQGLTRKEAREQFPDEYAAWQTGEDVRRGGGENYSEVGRRAAEALKDAVGGVPDGGVVVAVAHGGTIRAAIGTVLDLDVLDWWRLAPLGNTRWSVLFENRRGWQLEEHNAGTAPEEAGGDDAR